MSKDYWKTAFRGLVLKAGAGLLCLSALIFCISSFSGNAHADETELKITDTFPVNGGQDVFLTSGIEIRFNSEQVTQGALEEAVTISPEVGHYITAGDDSSTLVICPYDEYKPETQYTVTVHAGLTSEDGLVLKEDVVFTFNTASEDLVKYYQGLVLAPAGQGSVVNALTSELPVSFLMADQELSARFPDGKPEAEVTLYRFDTDEDFLKALVQTLQDRYGFRQGKDKDPSSGKGLHEEASFTLKAEEVTDNSYWWWQYKEYVLTFPESLSEGRYLARLDFPVKTDHQELVVTKYMLIQSTELSAFAMSSGQNSVAWLHNGITQAAESQAKVMLYDARNFLSGETDASGVSRLSEGSVKDAANEQLISKELADAIPESFRILDIRAGEHRFLEAISSDTLDYGYYGYYGNLGNTSYYTYIYTDRQIYSSTDEVHFFGVLRPRREGTSIPETLTVSIDNGWWGGEKIASMKVTPDAQGCFSGVLSFEDQQAIPYACVVVEEGLGGTLMTSDGFSIEEYVKPTYTYTVGADKPVYVLGKDRDTEAVVGIDISYFDDTPASGISISEEWSTRGLQGSGETMTADENGHLEDHVALNANQFDDSWYPQEASISYESADIEDEKLYISQNLMVIPRDVMLTAKADTEAGMLTVETHAIDTSGIQERKDLFDTENLKGEGLSLEVSGTMYKCWYEKVSDGIRYDYIYKRSYEACHYVYHEDPVQNCVIRTVNGTGTFSYHIEQDEENPACYYMKLSVRDSAGRTVSTTAGLYYRSLGRYTRYQSGEPVYRLKAVTENNDVPQDPAYWSWYYQTESKFSENAPAEFVLVRDDEEFELPEGAELLSAALLYDFTDIETGNSVRRTVDFSEDLLPNYIMTGAYFDGTNTWPLRITPMVFDYETRNLSLTVSPDHESYRPGDTVSVTISAQRKDSGESVPEGTKIALSVVDEAIFALAEQQIDILSRLYGRFSINYYSYSSRNTGTPSDGASGAKDAVEEAESDVAAAAPAAYEAGNGMRAETEYIRSDFKDTAYFEVLETGADGTASFSFTIPDNMTSWRLSAIGLTEDVWAGSTVSDIICTVPYYTVPVMNDIMLEGESFSIGLRSAGTAELLSNCSYEVSVRAEDTEDVILSGTAEGASLRDYASITLDGLKEGAYIVQIKGSCGDYTDVSEYPFTVVRSGLQAYAAKSGPVSELNDLYPLRYPVEMMIYDRDAYVYNAVLSRLLCSREIRADERLGAHYALTILASDEAPYFTEMLKDHDISDLRYIFPQFSYAKSNAEISALAYLAVPELLDSGVISGISPSDISVDLNSPYTGSPYAAYLLQALAKDEFTSDPAALLADDSLAFRDRIYLMAALFTAGEEDAAREAFEQYVLPLFESSEAVSGEVVYFLNADQKTTVQDDTAAALIMASLLHREEARGLALYLLEKPSDRDIYPLEQVLYLKNCEEKDPEPCTVSYTLHGESVTETLERNQRIYLELQRSDLEELNLTAVSGEPYATVFYIAGLEDVMDESTMKLTAQVSADKASYAVGEEAAITITPGIGTLDPSIGCSTMVLDVYIPSGMRFERYTPDTADRGHWYLVSREGQRLRFVIYDGSTDHSGDFTPVTFTASCVTPGEFILERVYLSSNHYDTWGMSERGTIEITAE